jgi:hypothetical protein
MSRVVSRRFLDKVVNDLFDYIRKKDQDMTIEYLKFYSDIDDPNNRTIFSFRDIRRNNVLLSCCIFELENAALEIIDNLSDSIDIGSINSNAETPLIISINNNMYNSAIELLNKGSEANIEQITSYGKNYSAIDFMVHKPHDIIEENIDILVSLLDYYLDNNPTSDIFHRNINYICENITFFGPLLQPHFQKNKLNFDKICKPEVATKASNIVMANTNNTSNTRAAKNIGLEATPVNIPLAIPANDANFDLNDHTDYEEESFRLPYRKGGKRTYKHKRTNKRRFAMKSICKQYQHSRRH